MFCKGKKTWLTGNDAVPWLNKHSEQLSNVLSLKSKTLVALVINN